MPVAIFAIKTSIINVTGATDVTPHVAGLTLLFVTIRIRHVPRLANIALGSIKGAFLATREQIFAAAEGTSNLILDKIIFCFPANDVVTGSGREIDVIADLVRVLIDAGLFNLLTCFATRN